MYKRILVPIDGSDSSKRGFDEALKLAAESDATLRLLNVTSDFPIMLDLPTSIDLDDVRERLHENSRELLEAAKLAAERRGVQAETSMVDLKEGRVADLIVREAELKMMDLIVIGTHGRRGFQRALNGSDAETVARMSPVPVLLVRWVPPSSAASVD